MALTSRPNLDDFAFKQTPTSILSLDGQTSIKTVTGLTITDGTSDVILTASGATNDYVLTYINGIISLQPSSASGTSTTFDTNRYTTRIGVPLVCVGGVCTINNFLETYFFPSVPVSTSLSLTNNTREFGDSSSGTLSYSVIKNTNNICGAEIDTNGDGFYDYYPVSTEITGSCSGTYAYTIAANCAGSTSGLTENSSTYSISAVTITNESSLTDAYVTWRNKVYYFTSNTLYSDADASTIETIAQGLTGTQAVLSTGKTFNSKITFNNEFFYYMYPTTFGIPEFTVNNLPNNAWGSLDYNTLFIMSYTNSNGYLNQYYVARSDNRITGTYIIDIS